MRTVPHVLHWTSFRAAVEAAFVVVHSLEVMDIGELPDSGMV